MRGMSGVHDASQNGAGHLLSFTGTDTISAIDYAEEYYPDAQPGFIGGSVPATEHSVMCMGGEDDEIGTFVRLMDRYPSGVLSVVSDTWDFWQVITGYTVRLRDRIMARDGKLVFRPDSGDPVLIICGDPDAPADTPEHKGAVECLWDVFGGTTTGAGYRLLDSHVGLIYGDSINIARQGEILGRLAAKGFASGNVVLGIGSYTYQFVTRDTFGTAIKATEGTVGGVDRALSKKPKTDDGLKNSARGLLRVEADAERGFLLHQDQTWEQEAVGMLKIAFCDGKTVRKDGFSTIRARLFGASNAARDLAA
jgi:nicotinamide phosphoribosyltransferase